jgi:DNA repair exonuclease SbcCD nuclease subunit
MLLTKKTGASFLLIAGDLFDAARIDTESLDLINNYFKSLPNVDICIVAGNHDPYTPESPYTTYPWCDNVHIFTDKLDFFEKDNIRIYGRSFTGYFSRKTLLQDEKGDLPQLDENYTNILLMHGDISKGNSVYNPLDTNIIAELGFDYVALGHIHKTGKIDYAGDTPYCYSGIPQGRGFDETGDCGVVLCQVSDNGIRTKFVPTCIRRYTEKSVDVTGRESNDDICSLILENCPQDNNLYKVILTGQLPESFKVSPRRLQTLLEDKYLLSHHGCSDRLSSHCFPLRFFLAYMPASG